MSTTLGSSLIPPSITQWKKSSLVLAILWRCSNLDSWKRIPPHALTELADVVFTPTVSYES